jgi:hypothetical protein
MIWQYALKLLISASLVVAISEIAKRSSILGAVISSMPLTTILAFIWLYIDTGDTKRITALSFDIFWLVLPSLTLFIALPYLLRVGIGFWVSLALSCLLTVLSYLGMIRLLGLFKI